VSSALTEGIRVDVQSAYRAERSDPAQRRWMFTYSVRITNEGPVPAKLVARRWVITDANGEREEVVGEGVVGHQPHLAPGEQFEYTSYCVLETPHGSMRGSYRMVRDDGTEFHARIAPFPLLVPGAAN
jgi:ApaG protein